MSGLIHIRPGRCRCCCWLWDLRDMWLWHLRDMFGLRSRCISRRIWCLCRGHEWMQNDEEPIDVVGRTLTWHNTYLTYWRKMVWVVHPPVIYLIEWHPWIGRRTRNTLDISKLVHDPRWSVSDSNEAPAELTEKAWNQIKVPDPSVLPIWNPIEIGNPQSIQALRVCLFGYALHRLLRSNPPTCTLSYPNFIWGPLFGGMQPSLDRLEVLNPHR